VRRHRDLVGRWLRTIPASDPLAHDPEGQSGLSAASANAVGALVELATSVASSSLSPGKAEAGLVARTAQDARFGVRGARLFSAAWWFEYPVTKFLSHNFCHHFS
jgi:hypothetical protein